MIKVMLVDDHEMVRLGVSSYLSIQEDIEVVGEAENGKIGYESIGTTSRCYFDGFGNGRNGRH